MILDIVNTLVFLFGLCLFTGSVAMLYRNIKWARTNPLAVVIVAFLIDNVIDEACILIFSANVFIQAITEQSHDGINDIDPWAAVALRLLLFGSSAMALLVARRQVTVDEEKARQREREAAQLAIRVAGSLRTGK